jgi:glutathionylspermidine synthase
VQRIAIAPRADWRTKAEELGFDWHTAPRDAAPGEPYWDESAYWHFTAEEVDVLEAATEELHGMCMEAAAYVIDKKLLSHFGFDARAIALIEQSWQNRHDAPSIYGRFDFAYGGAGVGDGNPKMLEYNADTPTGLYEAAVVQWAWLQHCFPESDQFNSIHEGLVAAWTARAEKGRMFQSGLHFTSMTPHAEDEGTVRYLADTALEAGLAAKIISVGDIGWAAPSDTPEAGDFIDLQDESIRCLFKLVPWEWLLADEFGERLARKVARGDLSVIEPAWKMVLANKAILVALWDLFPDHPNLMPAYFDRGMFSAGTTVVAKPLLGREGANISIATMGEGGGIAGSPLVMTEGNYGTEGYVYQQFAPLAEAADETGTVHRVVIGSWFIDGLSRGIGLREDTGLVTHNRSRFVPHRFG